MTSKDEFKYGKFGHIIYEGEDGVWRWKDNDEPITVKRSCPKCNMMPIEDGEYDIDPCLGKLEGVQGACCGHGKNKGYIWFNNGKRLIFNSVEIVNE